MLEKLLNEFDYYTIDDGGLNVIEVSLAKELIKKYITVENCELWLQEQKRKNQIS